MASYSDYINQVVICKEIRDLDASQYWETEDGDFGVWLMGLDRKKGAHVGAKGKLAYRSLSKVAGQFYIKD